MDDTHTKKKTNIDEIKTNWWFLYEGQNVEKEEFI